MNYAFRLPRSSDQSGRYVFRSRPEPSAASQGSHYLPHKGPDYVSEFFATLRKWRSETAFFSDPEDIVDNASYRALVEKAGFTLPLILLELSVEPSQLVWVLGDAFKAEPFSEEDAGDINAMTDAWLAWGKKIGVHT